MIACHLQKEALIISREIRTKNEALNTLICLVCDVYGLDDFDSIYKLILERENLLSTGIGLEIAVPHCRIDTRTSIVAGAMLLPEGIDYDSVDGKPVKLIMLLISPSHDIQNHLMCLSSVSQAVSDEKKRMKLLGSKTHEELYSAISDCI